MIRIRRKSYFLLFGYPTSLILFYSHSLLFPFPTHCTSLNFFAHFTFGLVLRISLFNLDFVFTICQAKANKFTHVFHSKSNFKFYLTIWWKLKIYSLKRCNKFIKFLAFSKIFYLHLQIQVHKNCLSILYSLTFIFMQENLHEFVCMYVFTYGYL